MGQDLRRGSQRLRKSVVVRLLVVGGVTGRGFECVLGIAQAVNVSLAIEIQPEEDDLPLLHHGY